MAEIHENRNVGRMPAPGMPAFGMPAPWLPASGTSAPGTSALCGEEEAQNLIEARGPGIFVVEAAFDHEELEVDVGLPAEME